MITREEGLYLHWLTAEAWDGTGMILEFGPWLGGSTWCLATGMLLNQRRDPSTRLHAVDNFRWHPYMSGRAPLRFSLGESFLPAFEENIRSVRHLTVTHEARLPDDRSSDLEFDDPVRVPADDLPLYRGRDVDGDIRVLFVDGAKSWKAIVHVLRESSPFMRSGALLVLQDHRGWASWWIPMVIAWIQERLPGRIVPVHVTAFNTTTYRLTGSIEPEVLALLPETVDEVSVADGDRLLTAAANELRKSGAPSGARVVELSSVAFYGVKGDWVGALHRFEKMDALWPMNGSWGDLERARAWLAGQTGSLPRRSRRTWLMAAYRRCAGYGRGLVGKVRRLSRDGPTR